jgi:hypothetical protein
MRPRTPSSEFFVFDSRVNEQVGAAKRQSSGDATLAESRYDIGFRCASEAGLRQPR